MQVFTIGLASLAISFVFSMMGAGGSQILVSILFWLGLDFKTGAIPVGLLAAAITCFLAGSLYFRRGLVKLKTTWPLARLNMKWAREVRYTSYRKRRWLPVKIRKLKSTWNELGKRDPLWAILSNPEKKGNRWQVDEFFRTGEADVEGVLAQVRELGLILPAGRVLDFGCGVGRMTQHLSLHFREVIGVDIAPSMIELAEDYNRRLNQNRDRCHFYVNDRDDLKVFPGSHFDLILTLITLQHMEPRYFSKYLKEFIRLLTPEGLLIFQLPGERIAPEEAPGAGREKREEKAKAMPPMSLPQLLRNPKMLALQLLPYPVVRLLHRIRSLKMRKEPHFEMYGWKKEEVIEFIENNGGRVVGVLPDGCAGDDWTSYRYFVAKR